MGTTVGGGDRMGVPPSAAYHPYGMVGSAPVAPVFVQAPQYPLLMNPPHMPTYSYGVPPSPLAMHPVMGAAGTDFGGSTPQLHRMRRAESINAKIMTAVSP